MENPPIPASKHLFATCPENQPWHNSHLGQHRCLKARSEMPVGIWADGALRLGTFGLLAGFCHTKKTVQMGCCSWEWFGSSSWAGAPLPFISVHVCAYRHMQGKNQTTASHTLLHDWPEEKPQLSRSKGGTFISPHHPAQPHHTANSLRASTLRALGIPAKA